MPDPQGYRIARQGLCGGWSLQLPWAYYAFIALSACGVLVTLIGRNLSDQRRLGAVRVLDRTARIAYPVVVLAVALAYLLVF